MRTNVYIVEILTTYRKNGKKLWEPTAGVGITRTDGRLELAKWRGRNPCDKFRLKKYGRAP